MIAVYELPIRAFSLMGSNGEEKIEITIEEIFGFPDTTSYAGGYDFKGTLIIHAGCYKVYSQNFFSTTGELYNLYISFLKCYDSLTGIVKYPVAYLENNFEFKLEMTQAGHAIISGNFREYPHLPNKLVFEIGTDQTCIKKTIDDLKQVEKLFGGNSGKCIV